MTITNKKVAIALAFLFINYHVSQYVKSIDSMAWAFIHGVFSGICVSIFYVKFVHNEQ